MYPPAIFTVTDTAELHALLKAAGLGTLVTAGAGAICATHVPFYFDPGANVLRGHVSRRNPQIAAGDGGHALVLFQTLEAYVTPSWYPSKARHGKVAPTWNYEFLHVHGRVTWIEDREWLLRNVTEISDKHEAGEDDPWKVSDAPVDFVEGLLAGITGVEIAVDKIECRRKLSQHSSAADREGVIEGLSQREDPASRAVSDAMRSHYPKPV